MATRTTARRWLFWVPVRDMLTVLIWIAGLFGRHVTWRGKTYVLDADGRIRPLVPSAKPS